MNLFYTIPLKESNPFNIARFNLIWRFNYVLSVLFIVLLTSFVVQQSLPSIILFCIAFFITTGSLVYLYKTRKFAPVYFFIATLGIILPTISVNFTHEEHHYGNLVWIIVAICLAYFGLGTRYGKYFALAGIVSLVVHICFFLNENIRQMKSLGLIDKVALSLEVSVAMVMIFYIFYQYTTLYRLSEKQLISTNKALEAQNETIQKQNKEKEILLKEIHHRVKNNLQLVSSLLNLQSNSVSDASVISALHEGQSRIKTMSLLHHRLYKTDNEFSRLSFREYTTDLVQLIHSGYSGKNGDIRIEINIDNLELDIDTAIPLGLIINELCTNAYKYAFTGGGLVTVSITRAANGDLKLQVKDNGKGLPPAIKPEEANTLGLRLVNILTRQIRGELVYFNDGGANFIITFKDKLIEAPHENSDC